ncbi:MAG: GerMN domain-containing protein, partial [Coriobacteriales bacterium]|nr:GerMN domain-containing protein [Coriobacteriales bacterium]
AKNIVSLLVSENALPEGCALLSFTIEGKNGHADMNNAYGDAITLTGTAGEYMRVGCLVNTLLVFYDLDTITLTVEGQTITTGHVIYDSPLRFYENF